MKLSLATRLVLTGAALVSGSSIVHGQGWDGGVKSGISRAGLTAGAEFEWSYAPTTSVFVRHGLTRWLSIQPELAYVRRSGVSTVAGSTLAMIADNVEVPLLLDLRFPSAFGVAPYLSAGPSLGFRWRCRLQFLGGGLRTDETCEGTGGTRSRRVDVGIAGGGGLAFSVGAMTLMFEARGSTGLRTYVLPIDVRDARSVSWSLLAGVSMPLNRRRVIPPVRIPTLAARPGDLAVPAQAPSLRAAVGTVIPPSRRRLTLTADDVDIHEVLGGIAQATGYKVIVATQVHKRVTAALYDVTAEEAVQAIADVVGFTMLKSTIPGQTTLVVQNKATQPPSQKP